MTILLAIDDPRSYPLGRKRDCLRPLSEKGLPIVTARGKLRQFPASPVHCSFEQPCRRCRSDQAFLRRARRPSTPKAETKIKIADLFAGCGGMTLGLYEAARSVGCSIAIRLALDSDEGALSIYRANFPRAAAVCEDIGKILDGSIGSPPTLAEAKLCEKLGEVDILIGGPPCQGHSDLNNHTRRADPKNILYLRMARAAEILRPKVVVIENVATVHLDKGGVVQTTVEALENRDYKVDTRVLDLSKIGVPQIRRRFLLLATNINGVETTKILADLENSMPDHPSRTVGWAIDDLQSISSNAMFDTASKATPENVDRMNILFANEFYDLPNEFRPKCHKDKEHSYVSMYGRLDRGKPAQTITTGFGSMGQGRYVHPDCRRTITPHEAARLQTFPDWFKFGNETPRGVLASVIGNAVPPLLMRELGLAILPPIIAMKTLNREKTRRRA